MNSHNNPLFTYSGLLMKLKAGSDLFHYDSYHWTTSSVYNAHETLAHDSDDVDAKLDAFNCLPITALRICYKTLDNCYTYNLGFTATSARELFSVGYRRSDDLGGGGRKKFTDVFLPPGHPAYDTFWNGNFGDGCPDRPVSTLNPGINTDNNWYWSNVSKARIGYAVGRENWECYDNDRLGTIGLGLKTYVVPHQINAPWGVKSVRFNGPPVKADYQQAWLFGL